MPSQAHKWLRNVQHQAKYYARCTIKRYPALYVPLSRWRHGSRSSGGNQLMEPEAIGPGTEIVIEGPHRCGNTFAVVAFRLAQDRHVQVAHHLHAAAQVIVAVKRDIPTIVLLREPEETVVSRAASFPPITVKQALNEYLLFYSQVFPYRSGFVTATFETVTRDLDTAIRAINEKAGTQFKLFDQSDENVDRCFKIIEERYRGQAKPERAVARPSEDRRDKKETHRSQFHAAELATMRGRALRLYESMKAGAC